MDFSEFYGANFVCTVLFFMWVFTFVYFCFLFLWDLSVVYFGFLFLWCLLILPWQRPDIALREQGDALL